MNCQILTKLQSTDQNNQPNFYRESVFSKEGKSRRLGRLIGQMFGLQRVTESRSDEILRIVENKFTTDSENFYFPEDVKIANHDQWRKSENSGERKLKKLTWLKL